MSFEAVLFVSSLGCKVVLLLLYLAVIIHAKMGSHYSFVYIVAGLMIVGESAGAAITLILFNGEYSGILAFLLGSIYMSTFNIGHWIFARKYYLISFEIPFIMDGKEIPETLLHKKSVNIAFMVLCVLFAIFTYSKFINLFGPTVSYFFDLSQGVLCLISGTMLLVAVSKIRRFLKDHDQPMNTLNLFLHSTAFSLFVLGSLLYDAAIGPDGNCIISIDGFCNYVLTAAFIGGYLSQFLLCVILWELGTADEDDEETREETEANKPQLSEQIEIVEWDEEAETSARIWNLFAVKRTGAVDDEEERVSGYINAAQISRGLSKSERIKRTGLHEAALSVQSDEQA